MEWYKWVLGCIEFVAAWWATTNYIEWHKRPHQQPTITEHQEWLKTQPRVNAVGELGAPLNIPADWRQVMKRKETFYRDGWKRIVYQDGVTDWEYHP